MSRNNSRNCSCMLFVNGADDDATTCAFSRGVARLTEQRRLWRIVPIKKIVKTNIPLRIKENIIQFYFYYFNCWFTRSSNEIHWITPIGHRACAKHNCCYLENSFVYKAKVARHINMQVRNFVSVLQLLYNYIFIKDIYIS
jgi:hypothetical protein